MVSSLHPWFFFDNEGQKTRNKTKMDCDALADDPVAHIGDAPSISSFIAYPSATIVLHLLKSMPTAQVIKKRKRVTERKSAVDDSSKKPESDGARNYTVGRCDEVSDRYEKVGRRLGEGTYGIVYQAKDKVTGRYVALKRCIPHDQASDGFPVTTLREIQSLRLCSSHPNIVHLENVAVSRSGVFLVFEYW